MFTGQKHKERFLNEIGILKQSNSYFNKKFLSALYTITSDDFLWETSKNFIKYNHIDFNQINIKGISVSSHQLWQFAKSIGVEISGGEAQKLALARALYKDAPIVILDEPTAALDPIAEHEIYSRFNSFVENKTAIYISHRLSSCAFCDNIAVFDKAELVETGTHTQLIEKEGIYSELWNAQSKYYIGDERNGL